jgi:MFS-type transporter involved in bile tolerance (Atg22 family)
MRLNAWYAILFGVPLLFIASLLTFMVPETRKTAGKSSHSDEADRDGDDDSQSPPNKPVNRIKAFLATYVQALREVTSIWKNWRLLFLAVLVPFRIMTNALEELMQRYVSYRYDWTLGDAAFLHSLQAVVAGMILLVALPWISSALDLRGIGAVRKNVLIAETSLALLALGFAIQGLAPTVAVLIVGLLVETLGSGVPASIRALAGALSGDADHSRVFGGLTISETASIMLVYPLSAALFNAGTDLGGGIWLGLPFYSTAAAAALITFIMCFLRFERKEE